MKIGLFVWLAVVIIIGGVLYLTYPPSVKKREIVRYEYATPLVLENNAEWQALIDAYRHLETLDSWTPEYSKAEVAYNQRFRKFLWTDLDAVSIVDIPIVALTIQNAEIRINRYHERIGDLGYSKTSSDNSLISDVIRDAEFPDEVEKIVRKFLYMYHDIDDEGIEAVKAKLDEAKSEIGLIQIPSGE